MGQTRYGFTTPIGAAGGIVDIAPYAIDTFLNEENSGVLKFGVGVVQGSNPGVNIAMPESTSTAADFEGVTTNNRTTEYNVDGTLTVNKGASVGVMKYGRIHVRVAAAAKPEYGDSLYLITSGDETGCFTNKAAVTTGDNADTFTTIAVKGRFLGGTDSASGVASIELFNQARA